MYHSEVTIIIPVFNREEYLAAAVHSVLEQSYEDWRLLIVDDASTDGTMEVAQKFLADQRVNYIRLEQNVGTGKVLNRALKEVETPFFLILDSDDRLAVQAIDVLLTEMKRQPPHVSMVFGNTVMEEKVGGDIVPFRVERHRSFTDKYDFLMYEPMLYPRFLRTDTVRRVHGFSIDDPYEGRYMQDRYLLLKLIEISTFCWVNENLYHYLKHRDPSNTHWKNRDKYYEIRRYVYRKTIEQWGDPVYPVFEFNRGEWLHIKELIPNEVPTIGICTAKNRKGVLSKRVRYDLDKRVEAYEGAEAVWIAFAEEDYHPEEDYVVGYRYIAASGQWKKGIYPHPKAIYTRCRLSPAAIERMEHWTGKRVFNSYNWDKWQSWKLFQKAPSLKRHFPLTKRLKDRNELKRMLKKERDVFLKPYRGWGANGLIKIKRESKEMTCMYMEKGRTKRRKFNSFKEMWHFLSKRMLDQKYIIQKGIQTVTWQGRATDFRLNFNKTGAGTWKISLLLARGAGNRSYVAVGRGQEQSQLVPFRELVDGDESMADQLKERIMKLGFEIVHWLDHTGHHMGDIGIDLGLDQKQHLWIFEINTHPDPFDDIYPQDPSLTNPLEYSYFLATQQQ